MLKCLLKSGDGNQSSCSADAAPSRRPDQCVNAVDQGEAFRRPFSVGMPQPVRLVKQAQPQQ
jgi:hypothetical protein